MDKKKIKKLRIKVIKEYSKVLMLIPMYGELYAQFHKYVQAEMAYNKELTK